MPGSHSLKLWFNWSGVCSLDVRCSKIQTGLGTTGLGEGSWLYNCGCIAGFVFKGTQSLSIIKELGLWTGWEVSNFTMTTQVSLEFSHLCMSSSTFMGYLSHFISRDCVIIRSLSPFPAGQNNLINFSSLTYYGNCAHHVSGGYMPSCGFCHFGMVLFSLRSGNNSTTAFITIVLTEDSHFQALWECWRSYHQSIS